jgi:hypothetical protein
MSRADPPRRFAWQRQPGESWHDWDKRRIAENTAEMERQVAELPAPLDRLKAGGLGLAVGVGTYDCAGNPKGSGWW